MSIPFIDLNTQYNRLKSRIKANMDRVLGHGAYVMGPEIEMLERELAEYCEVEHAVACSSGTDALLLSLMSQDLRPGDAVLTTPFTFCATAEVIAMLQAVPVFVDIDPATFNLDPIQAEKAIQAIKAGDSSIHPLPKILDKEKESNPRSTPRIQASNLKGIISVDLFGLPCDYQALTSLARQHGLWLIADAAQSFGALDHGRSPCGMGDIACTSFFPAKPLGCYGDGGMCFTRDADTAKLLRSLRVHGQGENRYENVRVGLNARMDTMQAAILLAKKEIFPEELSLRREVAQEYNRLLHQVPGITTPAVLEHKQSTWAQYSLLARDREHRQSLLNALKEQDIPWAIYYPQPLHLQKVFTYLGHQEGDFPVSENTAQRIFSLPMHPYLNGQDQARIAEVLQGSRAS